MLYTYTYKKVRHVVARAFADAPAVLRGAARSFPRLHYRRQRSVWFFRRGADGFPNFFFFFYFPFLLFFFSSGWAKQRNANNASLPLHVSTCETTSSRRPTASAASLLFFSGKIGLQSSVFCLFYFLTTLFLQPSGTAHNNNNNRLGVDFPVSDEMLLREVWGRLSSCDHGIKYSKELYVFILTAS